MQGYFAKLTYKESPIGLKFAGRTDSRGAWFLYGSSGASRERFQSSRSAALGLAALAGVLWLLAAALEFQFDGPADASFPTILALPLLEIVRAAGLASGEVSWMVLVGVFFLGLIWRVLAHLLHMRSLDAFFAAFLAFEGFWVAHWVYTFPSIKNGAVPGEFSLWQQVMIGSALVLGGALFLVGVLRSPPPGAFRRTVSPRIANFSRRRQNRSRYMGAALMLAGAIAAASAPFLAFGDTEFGLEPVSMPIIFLAANIVYLIGKKCWKKWALGR